MYIFFAGWGGNTDKHPYHDTIFIQVIHYHADDSLKVHNSNITISKIPSFVLKHLASYILVNYGKVLKTALFSQLLYMYFVPVNMHTCTLNNLFFVLMRAHRDAIADAISIKRVNNGLNEKH